MEIGPLIETRYHIQRVGYLILHHDISKWQRSHRCLKLAFVIQTQQQCWRQLVNSSSWRIPAYKRGCLQCQNFLGWLKCCISTWAAAAPMHFGCAEQALENTHHSGVGTFSKLCKQLGWEVLLSLLLAWACRAAFHVKCNDMLISLKHGRVLHWTGPWVTILLMALALYFLSLVHMPDR